MSEQIKVDSDGYIECPVDNVRLWYMGCRECHRCIKWSETEIECDW